MYMHCMHVVHYSTDLLTLLESAETRQDCLRCEQGFELFWDICVAGADRSPPEKGSGATPL